MTGERRRALGFHVAALCVLGVCLYANQLWVGGLPGNDDGTYAAGALDMMQAHDYLTPRFDGEPQFSTAPPAFYWLLAGGFKALGPTDYAARTVGACGTLAAILIIFLLGLRLFESELAGALAACAFALDPFIVKSGHHAVAHTWWAATAAAALLALYEARRKPAWHLAYALLCAASILFKSLLGLFPLLIGGLWLLWDGAERSRWAWFGASALGALGLGGAWFAVEYARYGHHFVYEHFGAMLFGYAFNYWALDPQASVWRHAATLLRRTATSTLVLLPLLVPPLWKDKSRAAKLVLAWLFVPLACLAPTARFEPRYMAPLFPALALAVAFALRKTLREQAQRRALTAVYAGTLLWGLATLAYPIPRGRDFLAEARPLIAALDKEVPADGRWLLVVSPKTPIDPAWQNRGLVDSYELDGPLNRGLIQQLLFYTRRRYEPVHAEDLGKPFSGARVVLAQDKYLPRGSAAGLTELLAGPDWTLYRQAPPSARAAAAR